MNNTESSEKERDFKVLKSVQKDQQNFLQSLSENSQSPYKPIPKYQDSEIVKKQIDFSSANDSNKENIHNSQNNTDVFNKIWNYETPNEPIEAQKPHPSAQGTSETKFNTGGINILSEKSHHKDYNLQSALQHKFSPKQMNVRIPKFDLSSENEGEEQSFIVNRLVSNLETPKSESSEGFKFNVIKQDSILSSYKEEESEGEVRREILQTAIKKKRRRASSSSSSQPLSKNSGNFLEKFSINNSENYASPRNDMKNTNDSRNKIFDYKSSRHSKSFDYSGRECPITPDKRNKRAVNNTDLLSPVTRILSLDQSSAKVSFLEFIV